MSGKVNSNIFLSDTLNNLFHTTVAVDKIMLKVRADWLLRRYTKVKYKIIANIIMAANLRIFWK